MLAVPMSFGPLFIQPTNSLAIWPGGKSLQEIQEITFEIGMLGQYGLDINDPRGRTSCGRCRRGRSRRWSWCASCTPGLQRIEPGMDIGEELDEERMMAERLMGEV